MASHRKRKGARRRSPPGAPPGTVTADPDAPRPVVRVMAFGPGELLERTLEDVGEIRDLRDRFPVTWVNVDGLGDADLIRRMGEVFGLHPLALEDVVNVHQRSKVERYGEVLFAVSRMVFLKEELETEQVSLFLGKGFLLTFQEREGDCLDPVRDRIRRSKGQIRQAGPDYLAYSLLDAVVDGYFPVLERFGERIEALETEAEGVPGQATISRIHELKRDLVTLRRAIWSQREAFGTLLRDRFPQITEETLVYLRDCYDHAVRVVELVESYREQGADLVSTYMSSVSNRMNEIMKVLTIIATIFIPLTFIAGVYGMNFDPGRSPLNMPELRWYWGYPFALGLMAVSVAGLLAFFRRKKWL
jgi:magnesium transporter